VRFFGANLAFGGNFPEEKDAARIAKRLRRLGVNLARLHHMDTQPDADPNRANSLLTTGPYPTLNPVSVGRLRKFLDALAAEGIYVNLNLLVGYVYRPGTDGVAALPGGAAMPTQSKPLRVMQRRMLELGKKFTADVIEALALKDDPVLAMVEISNESSIIYSWQTGALDRDLMGEYAAELQREWNNQLRDKYGTVDGLREAWGTSTPDSDEMLLREKWQMELDSASKATVRVVDLEGEPSLEVEIAQTGTRTICKQVGFSVEAGAKYRAEFEIRADLPEGTAKSVYWDVKQDVSPWRTMHSRTFSISSQWQKQSFAFDAGFPMEGVGRYGFYLQGVVGKVWVRRWSLRRMGIRGLEAAEDPEGGSVELVKQADASSRVRLDDYLLFLTERDRYAMREFLGVIREKAGQYVPVAGTQIGFGGMPLYDSQQDLDYQDNHFYVDHYVFPNVSWDGRDWLMRDTSSVGSGLSAFLRMAITKEAGKPFTVSEYNQPWPNRFAAEIDPALAAFGAFQDWDSIMHFAYAHNRNWDDGVPNGFNLTGDWTKLAGLGQSAWIFRTGAIRTGHQPLEIPVSLEARLRAARERRNGSVPEFLQAAMGYNPNAALVHPVRVRRAEDEAMPEEAKAPVPDAAMSDSGELTYDRVRKLLLIHAPMAAGVIGFAGEEVLSAGAIEVQLAKGMRGFACVLLTPLDAKRLEESQWMLLSNPGYTLRTQPGTSPERPQRIENYAGQDGFTLEREPGQPNKPSGNLNGGNRPVWMERVEAVVTLRSAASKLTVYPLDGAGNRMAALEDADVQKTEQGFRIHLQTPGQAPAPWYEIKAENP
jgi:hypothetical protein